MLLNLIYTCELNSRDALFSSSWPLSNSLALLISRVPLYSDTGLIAQAITLTVPVIRVTYLRHMGARNPTQNDRDGDNFDRLVTVRLKFLGGSFAVDVVPLWELLLLPVADFVSPLQLQEAISIRSPLTHLLFTPLVWNFSLLI